MRRVSPTTLPATPNGCLDGALRTTPSLLGSSRSSCSRHIHASAAPASPNSPSPPPSPTHPAPPPPPTRSHPIKTTHPRRANHPTERLANDQETILQKRT